MISDNRYNIAFFLLLAISVSFLIFSASSFSISYKEATIFFDQNSLLSYIIHFFTDIFGQTSLSLRLPFILFYIGSVTILWLLTDDYFKKQSHRVVNIAIFMILPGLYSAGLFVNEAIMVVFFTLLYLYLFKLTQKEHYILLVLFLFIDNSFAILYLALVFYSLKKKDNTLLYISFVLFVISMIMYGFDISGHPQGYFIDTFGIYASIFSPLLFLYFFYSLYRVGLKKDKDLYWYISITALGLSLILSLRQKVALEDFAPFVVISTPIMVKLFFHSLNVRLKMFRTKYYIIAFSTLAVLIINFFILVFNKYLYIFLDTPKDHFAYKYHIAKELSDKLKALGILKINLDDKKMQKRLKYYGIDSGKSYFLYNNSQKDSKSIDIKYNNIIVKSYYLK